MISWNAQKRKLLSGAFEWFDAPAFHLGLEKLHGFIRGEWAIGAAFAKVFYSLGDSRFNNSSLLGGVLAVRAWQFREDGNHPARHSELQPVAGLDASPALYAGGHYKSLFHSGSRSVRMTANFQSLHRKNSIPWRKSEELSPGAGRNPLLSARGERMSPIARIW